jgi:hypothetical protein
MGISSHFFLKELMDIACCYLNVALFLDPAWRLDFTAFKHNKVERGR